MTANRVHRNQMIATQTSVHACVQACVELILHAFVKLMCVHVCMLCPELLGMPACMLVLN